MTDKQALRRWVLERNPSLDEADLADDTPLIERRYLTSLQVPDLLVFIEQRRGRPVDPARLKPGAFRSIDAIHGAFFA
jgi:hypothetical protein